MRPDVRLNISYDRAAFDDETIDRVVAQLVATLKSMLDQIDRPIVELLRRAPIRPVSTAAHGAANHGASMPAEIAEYLSCADDDARICEALGVAFARSARIAQRSGPMGD
jgi:hypothetical protein